jgi:predicted nucleotidyltransferase
MINQCTSSKLSYFFTFIQNEGSFNNKTNHTRTETRAQKKFHVSSIGIFGSVVRNDFAENSDIDIIVDFSQPIGIEFIDLADLLEEKFHEQVDLVSKKRNQAPIFFID